MMVVSVRPLAIFLLVSAARLPSSVATLVQPPSPVATVVPVGLTVEYQAYTRQFVDTPQPRFSWRLQAAPTAGQNSDSTRGIDQNAYQLRIWQVGEKHATVIPVWDSGRVAGNKTLHVEYSGTTALLSDAEYRWNVVVWTTTVDGSIVCRLFWRL